MFLLNFRNREIKRIKDGIRQGNSFSFLCHDIIELEHSNQVNLPRVTIVMPLKGFGEHNLHNWRSQVRLMHLFLWTVLGTIYMIFFFFVHRLLFWVCIYTYVFLGWGDVGKCIVVHYLFLLVIRPNIHLDMVGQAIRQFVFHIFSACNQDAICFLVYNVLFSPCLWRLIPAF